MIQKVLTMLLLALFAGNVNSTAQFRLSWGKAEYSKPATATLVKGGALTVMFEQKLDTAQARRFFKQTMVAAKPAADAIGNFDETLYNRMKNSGHQKDADNHIASGKISKLNLADYWGELKKGSVVSIKPYVGNDKNGKPLISESYTLTITDATPPGTPTPKDTCYDCETLPDGIKNLITKSENHPAWEPTCKDCNTACIDCDTFSSQRNYVKSMIYYDFNCKQFYTKDKAGAKTVVNLAKEHKLRNNDYLQLTVENVNRYLYDVHVAANNVSYGSNMPPLLEQLFIGDTSSFIASLLDKIIPPGDSLIGPSANEGTTSNGNKTECLTKAECRYKQFTEAVDGFSRVYSQLEARKLEAYMLCTKFQCCEDNEKMGIKLQDMLYALSYVRIKLADLQLAIAQDPEAKKAKEKYLKDIEDLMECQKDDAAAKAAQKQLADFEKTIGKDTTGEEATELQKLQKASAAAVAKKRGDEYAATLKKKIAAEEVDMKTYANFDNLQANLPSELEIKKTYLFVRNMLKANNHFVTPPIYITGNRLELEISITPRDSSMARKFDIMPFYEEEFYLDLAVRGRPFGQPFVTFSSGSFVALDRYVQNKTYTWQNVPNNSNQVVTDSNKYVLTESGYTPKPIGFSALLHVQSKVSPQLGFGLSAGVGLTVESQPRVAYLGGGSILLGDLKQIVVTYGFIGMNVDRLDNNLQAIADNNIIYRSNTQPTYYKEFRTGHFISLSYTPFNTSRRPILKAGKERRETEQAVTDAEAKAKIADAKAKEADAKAKEAAAKDKSEDK